MRRAIYVAWVSGQSISDLAKIYKVSRPTIYKILKRARLQEFNNRKSTNKRFRTIEYGLRKLSLRERKIQRRLDRLAIKRYEKTSPGEMVHFDTKRLPLMEGRAILDKREHLHVAIDDYSRYLTADILPNKNQYSGAIHLEEVLALSPYQIETAYSDNGSTYRGRQDHAFVATCREHQISQGFTRPRTPKTNGKAERVIRTIMTEWCRRQHFSNSEQRRQSLQEYVNYYNYQRPHGALKGLTPMQRITNYIANQSVNNA
jgi:transposase InsO family protein